jgi:hypothetical protein
MNEKQTLKKLAERNTSLIFVPWNGENIPVRVRELTDLQIQAIGQFSLIETNAAPKSTAWGSIASLAVMQNEITRAALVSPTYDEIFKIVGENDLTDRMRAKYIEVQKDLLKMPKGPERSALENRAEALRLLFEAVLPNDFLAAVTAWATGVDRTDIKLVTREILLNASILQRKYGGRASDYCTGNLSEFNKRDIDTQALIVFSEFEKQIRAKSANGKQVK